MLLDIYDGFSICRKNMQIIYILLSIVGAALPLSQYFPWLFANALNVPLLLQQVTSSNIDAFAWADVLVSGIVVIVFIITEGCRLGMRRLWLPLSCIVVGPSLALSFFLFLLERHLAVLSGQALKPTPSDGVA